MSEWDDMLGRGEFPAEVRHEAEFRLDRNGRQVWQCQCGFKSKRLSRLGVLEHQASIRLGEKQTNPFDAEADWDSLEEDSSSPPRRVTFRSDLDRIAERLRVQRTAFQQMYVRIEQATRGLNGLRADWSWVDEVPEIPADEPIQWDARRADEVMQIPEIRTRRDGLQYVDNYVANLDLLPHDPDTCRWCRTVTDDEW